MSKKINTKIDDALLNYYLSVDDESLAEELKNNIEEYDKYNFKKQQIANRIEFLAKATENKLKNERLLDAVEKFQEALKKNIERPIAMLKQIMQNKSSLAFNQNLSKLTKEEIIEIIKDKNLIELLEELKRNETT